MATFQPYVGLSRACLKEMSRQQDPRAKQRDKLEETLQALLDVTLKCLPTINGSLNQESITLLFEMNHYLLSHKVYYLETGMAKSLMKTNIKLQLSDLKLPYRIFEVSFKDDLLITEGPVPSFMIAVMPGQAEVNACNTFMQSSLQHRQYRYTLNESVGDLVYIRYQAPEGGICHANIPAELFVDRSIDEVVDALGERRLDTFQFTVEFTEADKTIQKTILRIVMGLLCYINTEAPDVQQWSSNNRPAIGNLKPQGWRVGAALPEAWFLRKGHFMVLRHERYARQDSGKARVVWRRPHEVLNRSTPLKPDARGEIIEEEKG